MKPAYLESLNFDFLRGCAVLMVLFNHLMVYHGNPIFFGIEVSMFGKLGVIFFFVHTAWVLMMSLERQTDRFGTRGYLGYFYSKRFFRIYPLSIATVAVIAFFGLPLLRCVQPLQSADLNFEQLMANFLLVQNFYKAPDILGPLWSLAVEFQAYLVFPFVFLFIRKMKSAYSLIFLWAFSSYALIALVPKINKLNSEILSYYQVPDIIEWIPCFLAGVIAYKMSSESRKTWPFWTLPAFVAVSIPLYVLVWDFSKGYFASLAVAILLTQTKEMQSAILISFSKVMAKYSYSCYLGHYFAIWLGFEWAGSQSPLVQWGVFVGSLVGICLASYHLIEKPGIQWGAKFAARFVKDNKPSPPSLKTAA